METSGPQKYFETYREVIEGINSESIVPLNMPYEEAVHEGERVAALAQKYGDFLRKSAIDPELLKTVTGRAGAFAYTVSMADIFRKGGQDNNQKWQERKKVAYNLRRKIQKILLYVFRRDEGTKKRIAKVMGGRGDLDMIKDLLSYYQLAMEKGDDIRKANIDMDIFLQASSLHAELTELVTFIAIDPDSINMAQQTCLKAWTFLKEALDEIYEAGRIVFMDEPEIEELFYSDYWQEIGKRKKEQEIVEQPEVIAG